MPRYRITMINSGIATVVIYAERSDAKTAYDNAVAYATLIFGTQPSDKPHAVIVEEVPAA